VHNSRCISVGALVVARLCDHTVAVVALSFPVFIV
jgi:hypothetical protein